jgi:Cu+-exporting ATPase
VVLSGWDGHLRGVLAVGYAAKESSAEAVAQLHGLGPRRVSLTGHSHRAAAAIAETVGINEVIAEVPPEQMVDATHRRIVAMAGDGVNDAASLATADLRPGDGHRHAHGDATSLWYAATCALRRAASACRAW